LATSKSKHKRMIHRFKQKAKQRIKRRKASLKAAAAPGASQA